MSNPLDPTPGPDPGRDAALDGLRGCAATIVVVYHAILGCSAHALDVLGGGLLEQRAGYDRVLKVALSLCNGELAVALFFVMSGLVLFRALAGMDRHRASASSLSWRFLLRRLLRLWPTMAICLVVHTLVLQAIGWAHPGFTEWHSMGELVDNLLLLRTSVVGPTWTLVVELGAAPWLLLLYLGVRRWGVLRMVPVLAAGIVALRVTGVLYHPAGMLTGLPMLLAGAMIGGVSARGWLRWPVWRLALPAGFAIALGNELFVSLFVKLHALLLVVGAALIVSGVAAGSSGGVRWLLERNLPRFLGRISYSLYLWNVLTLLVLLGLVGPEREQAHPLEVGLAIGVVAVLLTIPVAVVSERWTERPFIHLGRMLTRSAPRQAAREATYSG